MVQDLRSVVDAVRNDGRQRTTHCPAHDDQTASLSVGRGAEDRIVLTCHAGCERKTILKAAGMAWADLFSRTATPPTINATYDYTDETGVLLFQVVRYAPKKGFRQRRPDGAGGWIWNLTGVRRVLFDLPALTGHTTIYVVEGERDVITLRNSGFMATTNPSGAGKWRQGYTQQLVAAGCTSVVVLPDNDEPGRRHAEDVAKSCRAAGLNVRIVNLPDLPDRGDVSTWLESGHTTDDLRALVDAPKTPTAVSAAAELRTLADIERVFGRWIRDDDPIPTRAVLAAYVANKCLEGDPVWLILVGGSGVGKTERLTPLGIMPDVVLESSITGPAALLSGSGRKDRAKDATGGLLRKLPDGRGMLLLKDFTSIIDMHRDSRAEVLAAFREIYDGRWDRSVGADGGRTLTWTGRVGLLAGCTTAIDSAHSVIATMGTRFLLVRLHGDADLAGAAFDHVGQENSMRDELRAAVRGLLDNLPGVPFDKAEVRAPMVALASYVARARSPVDRDSQSNIRLVLDPEAPTRIVKMLTQLWRASGLIGMAKADAWAMVRRIGLDSIPKLRRQVLDVLASKSPATTASIAEAVGHPPQTTRRALEDLVAHRVATRQPVGKGDSWRLHPEARAWLDQTVPVLSANV